MNLMHEDLVTWTNACVKLSAINLCDNFSLSSFFLYNVKLAIVGIKLFESLLNVQKVQFYFCRYMYE